MQGTTGDHNSEQIPCATAASTTVTPPTTADRRHKKPVLAYVVTEPGCMRKGSGAHQHINVGIKYLGNAFHVQAITPPSHNIPDRNAPRAALSPIAPWKHSILAGTLRDVRLLLRNAVTAFRIAARIRSQRVPAVYLRASFLDPLPLLLRAIRVPCFLEVNGILYEDRIRWQRSLFEFANRWFEKHCYMAAAHVFFIGSYGDYWQLPTTNWTNIENGVEPEYLENRIHKEDGPRRLRLVFAGTLHPHHEPEVLVNALRRFSQATDSELHLIGSGLTTVASRLSATLPVECHGILDRPALIDLLRTMDIGLISGGPEYASHMKLFDYAAAGVAVVAPATYHLKKTFPTELGFFDPHDAASLADTLERISSDKQIRTHLASALRRRVKHAYTWPDIYAAIMRIITAFDNLSCRYSQRME